MLKESRVADGRDYVTTAHVKRADDFGSLLLKYLPESSVDLGREGSKPTRFRFESWCPIVVKTQQFCSILFFM